MPVDLQSYSTKGPLDPYKLLVDLRKIVDLTNKLESRGVQIETQLGTVARTVEVIAGDSGGGGAVPAPIGPFPSVVVGIALQGSGTAVSPVDVRVDGVTVVVNASNQLTSVSTPPAADTLTGTLTPTRVPYASAAHVLSDSANLFWDNPNGRLGIGNSAPSTTLHVTGSARITSLTAARVPFASTGGLLVDQTNFVFDTANTRLGIGNAAPAETLHVTGTARITSLTTPRVPYAGTGGLLLDNGAFNWDNANTRLFVPTIVGGTGVNDDLILQSTSGVGTINSRIFFKVGTDGGIIAVEIQPDSGGNFGRLGIGTPGNLTVSYPLTVFGTGPDIGILGHFHAANGAPSAFVQCQTGAGANEQAGFSFYQTTNAVEWRMAVVGNEADAMRWQVITGGGAVTTSVVFVTKTFNLIIDNARSDPGAGSKCLILGDGTVPSSLASNTAGLYANDVGGTVQLFGINEAGESTQLTGVPTFTSSSTGTVNDLATGDVEVVYLDNATDLTLTGMDAGRNGQRRLIVSRGAGNVFLSHQTGSTAANQFFNNVTSGQTPLFANKGSAVYEYDSSISRWRLINHTQGNFISIAFSAGNYTGNGAMTWTLASGDQTSFRYLIEGNKISVIIIVATTTVGGTLNTQLLATIPYTIGQASRTIGWANDNGTVTSVRIFLVGGGTQLAFQRFDGANWSASTDNTAVESSIFGQVT